MKYAVSNVESMTHFTNLSNKVSQGIINGKMGMKSFLKKINKKTDISTETI
jgi:hypothetical protein